MRKIDKYPNVKQWHESLDVAGQQRVKLTAPMSWGYPGSNTFKVFARPLGGKQQEFIQEATEPQWDLALMKKNQVLSHKKYLKLFVEYVVVDWEGLTIADLKRLVLLKDWKKVKQFKSTESIGCDTNSRRLMITFSPGFSAWFNQVTLDVESYNAEREAEAEKKS